MMKENFWGRIGTYSGVSDGDYHCCDKESLPVALHKKSLIYGLPNQWYIQSGTGSTSVYFSRTSLLSFENGGPMHYNLQV